MPLTNFTNLDFDQIKTTLKDYLRANSNFTDYDFEGSNLSSILDVLAYNTYITSYNANMVANEVFIDSATLRENVVSLARNIGYVPRSRKASRATISFLVDTTAETQRTGVTPTAITLHRGPVAATSSSFGNQSFIFSILDDITVPVVNNIAEFNDISVYEGSLLNSNFTYSNNNPNQRFIVSNIGVDTSLLSVSVRGNNPSAPFVKYELKEDIFDITSDSKTYFLQEIDGERYEIFFGDGVFGKALEEGDFIDVRYITTTGPNANGVNQFAFSGRLTYTRNDVENIITSGISLVTTGLISSGGDTIEPVESVRKYAPKVYGTQNRAVTARDYEVLIPSKIYPETEAITVFGGEELIPPQYGKVFISIKPRTGDFLPNIIKDEIKLKLKKYAVAGILPEILDLKYLYIEVNSKVYYNTNFALSTEQISSIVQANARKYSESTELNRYGARFKYSRFLKIIDDSHEAVTSNITTISMRRDARVSLNSLAEYSIGFGNRFHIRSFDGYNIKSSGFRIPNVDSLVYLSDIPNTNGETGSLFFFTVPTVTSNVPTIISQNVGKIDYVNGIVTLNPINILDTLKSRNGRPIIEISATPQSNDVIGLQDLYLQLDINSSVFDMVVDSISSGLNPSGSQYVQSSSYNNGNLVRI